MLILYKLNSIEKTAFELLNHENLTCISIIRIWGKLLEDLKVVEVNGHFGDLARSGHTSSCAWY